MRCGNKLLDLERLHFQRAPIFDEAAEANRAKKPFLKARLPFRVLLPQASRFHGARFGRVNLREARFAVEPADHAA